jgi:hypothetical protein
MYIVRGEIEHIYISYQNLSRWQIIILKILYHHTGTTFPSMNQTVDCNVLGQYIVIYNERNRTASDNTPGYSDNAWLELCDVYVLVSALTSFYTEMYIVRGEIEHIYISYQNLSRWQIIIFKILYLINENDSVKTC